MAKDHKPTWVFKKCSVIFGRFLTKIWACRQVLLKICNTEIYEIPHLGVLRHVQTDRQTERQTDRQRERQTDRQTGRQAGRQAGRETETDRERETDRHDTDR
jgi:hypothetical protein